MADGEPLVGRVDEPAAVERRGVAGGLQSPASSVTPWARSRSGSTSTWNCRSRWPQIATLATPGTAISRGRIVHGPARSGPSATASRTRRRSSSRGWSTRAARDHRRPGHGGQPRGLGRQPLLHELPRLHQVGPFLEDQHDRRQPEHRFRAERLQPGVPLSAFSSGTLIRLSTSSVDRPGASVWISTSGGANSGNTSSGIVPAGAR